MFKKINSERLAASINKELDSYRPMWKDFDGVYPRKKIEADKAELDEYRKRKGIYPSKERNRLKDGLLIEKVFFDIKRKDYFGENSLYDELLTNEDDFLLFAFPAHEYDDTFNNADMICLVRNSLTNHETTPFVVDCTSNSEKVEDKMGYRRTANKVTGFTDLEYFKNTVSSDDIEPRKVERVPRFVVGFDANLAREIVTAEYSDWTKDELDKKYNQVNYRLLKELSTQAKFYDTKLDKYFDRLLEHFIDIHNEFDISHYLNDPVMDKVLKTIEKKQEKDP